MSKHEVIIIGSGPGGAISAYELQKRNVDIALLEAGHSKSGIPSFSPEEMLEKYWKGGTTFIWDKAKIPFVTAKCVGGGSEINGGQYHRLPHDILSKWNLDFALNITGIEDQYDFIEEILQIKEVPDTDLPLYSHLLSKAALNMGWKATKPKTWSSNHVNRGMKDTFLKNIKIKENHLVTRIKRTHAGWKVLTVDNEYFAKKVIVCAGAIQSPSILKNSGVEIKRTFSCHPMLKIQAKFNQPVNPDGKVLGIHQIKEFSPQFSMGCSVSPLPYLVLLNPTNREELYREKEFFANYYISTSPENPGSVNRYPFLKEPITKIQLTQKDWSNLNNGHDLLVEALKSVGAVNFWKGSLSAVHLFSSIPAGENKNRCSANSYGKIFNFDNLYVNDGSLLPSAPSVNPQGIIMALARRNILHFIEENNY